MMTLFDDDEILEAYMETYTKDIKNSEARETAKRMIKDGELSLDKIAQCVPSLSMDELRALEAEMMHMA